MRRIFENYLLYFLIFILVTNAFYGGISFIIKPDGSLLGMNPGWLEKSPFSDFMIPGILSSPQGAEVLQ